MLVYGRNVAKDLIRKNEKIKKIIIQENFDDKELISLIEKKKFNVQIIIVSHSPLMLSNIIQDNDNYNFISIDNTYTKEMKKLFSGVKF